MANDLYAREAPVLPPDEMARAFRHRFSWGISFAGAAIAAAATLLLLALGAGVGLTLVRAQQTVEPAFLTLGAVYFLAAQAFGFAAGAHVAGRLIGPAPESAGEEGFRAAAHGLVVWAIGATGTAAFIAITGSAIFGGGLSAALAIRAPGTTIAVTPAIASYWTDMLFRPPVTQEHASIAWQRYAQADTGTQTDASPQAQPMQAVPAQPALPAASPETAPNNPSAEAPPATANSPPLQETPPAGLTIIRSPTSAQETQVPLPPPARNIEADKTEVARILEVDFANGGRLSASDKQRIASLIIADAGLGPEEATRRVADADQRLHDKTSRATEFARKAVRNASLWTAFALLFGAIVAAAAAVSARWTDDRVTFRPARREPI